MPISTLATQIEEDKKLATIESQVLAIQSSLQKNYERVKNVSSENEFLKFVKDNYANYINERINEYKQVINAFGLLSAYVADLKKSNTLSDHNIKDAVAEQDKILTEMNKLQNELDTLIKSS